MRLPLLLTTLLFALPLSAQEPPAEFGPAKGSLIIIGGGGKTLKAMLGEMVERAGGTNAHMVVIPTAASSDPDHKYERSYVARMLVEKFDVKSVTLLHTHDREEADTDAFVKPLKKATGVWLSGGRQWRFTKAYAGTKTEAALHAVLARGGVIAGSSAGATIQGSFLARGDTSGNTIMVGDVQRGFGFLKHSAIDQHLLARKRELDLIKVLEDPREKMRPEFEREKLLGIGIDEDSAIVVEGDIATVIGKPDAAVLFYDPTTWTEKTKPHDKYLKLGLGDRYDLKRRRRIIK